MAGDVAAFNLPARAGQLFGASLQRVGRKVGTGGLIVDIGPLDNLPGMIPEIDIWRVANLMLTCYGEEAMLEGAKHAHELALDGDCAGAATWLRITNAIAQLANTTPQGPLH